MIVNVIPKDESIIKYGLEKRAKMLEQAVKASTACGMAMLPQTAELALTTSALRIVSELAKRPRGFSGPIHLADGFREAMKNAASLYLSDCAAVRDKLTKLGAGAGGLDTKSEEARSVHDRLSGELELFADPHFDPMAPITHCRIGERGGVEFSVTEAGGVGGDWTTYHDGKPMGRKMPTLDELASAQEAGHAQPALAVTQDDAQ